MTARRWRHGFAGRPIELRAVILDTSPTSGVEDRQVALERGQVVEHIQYAGIAKICIWGVAGPRGWPVFQSTASTEEAVLCAG